MLLKVILLVFGALNTLAIPVSNNVKNKGDATYFLPDNAILPESYKIHINVKDSFINIEDHKFTGRAEIKALVNENVENIVLHAAQIKIDGNIEVLDINGDDYYKDREFNPEKQFLILKLSQPLIKGTTIVITFESYEGVLQTDMHGFYVSSYTEKDSVKPKYVLTTQFQPTHARKAFPCFDEPKYKATFEISFEKEAKYQVISNMPSNEPNNGRDLTTVSFGKTPVMSTYLVAFIVHEFSKSTSPANKNYNVWSRPDANYQTHWATRYVYPVVDDLNKFTGINYQDYIPKMDMAALPDFSAGAMENWGLLTYRETALLVDDTLSTRKDIQRVVSVISHEVAHQWFGNLVTLNWWKNTWLNEGFARYFEYHTTGNVLPEWEMEDQFVVEQQQNVFGVDALAKTTPLTLDVYTPSEISSHFGSISYSKGGSVIRMMENFLGSDIYKKALQHYLFVNKLSNTEPQDLWDALQDVIDAEKVPLEYNIKGIMSNWISQAGYPVINVKNDSNGHITFSQQRFYINPEENTGKASKQNWFVPISYTTSKDLDFENKKPTFWLTPNEPARTISLENNTDYLVVNIQESGYYRVNYDDTLWQSLAKVLPEKKGNKIHHLNKAQIVDDVLNLARAGMVDYKIAFTVTDFLANETNYYPWYSAFQSFRYLLQRYSDTEETGMELRTYLRYLMELLVKDKEFVVADEKQVQVFNKVAALEWACNLGHERCVKQAKEKFKAFKDGSQDIPKDLRSIIYCTALRNGKREDWDFLWDRFVASNVAAEKIGIINALGCSNETIILQEFLQKSITADSGIRKQDALYVFTAVYTGNSKGVDVAFEFLEKNHDQMLNSYNGMNDLEKAVLGLGGRLTNKKKIQEFKKLLDSESNFENFRDAAKETVDQNVAWADKYGKIIGGILTKKRTGSAAGIIANKYVIFSLGFISIYLSMFN